MVASDRVDADLNRVVRFHRRISLIKHSEQSWIRFTCGILSLNLDEYPGGCPVSEGVILLSNLLIALGPFRLAYSDLADQQRFRLRNQADSVCTLVEVELKGLSDITCRIVQHDRLPLGCFDLLWSDLISVPINQDRACIRKDP